MASSIKKQYQKSDGGLLVTKQNRNAAGRAKPRRVSGSRQPDCVIETHTLMADGEFAGHQSRIFFEQRSDLFQVTICRRFMDLGAKAEAAPGKKDQGHYGNAREL